MLRALRAQESNPIGFTPDFCAMLRNRVSSTMCNVQKSICLKPTKVRQGNSDEGCYHVAADKDGHVINVETKEVLREAFTVKSLVGLMDTYNDHDKGQVITLEVCEQRYLLAELRYYLAKVGGDAYGQN